MIGIYINKQIIRFLKKNGTGEIESSEYSALDEFDNPISNMQKVFEAASSELGFSHKSDFRLLVDFPLCHFVVQSVPFAETQLAQVLENYLEEELPDDIDQYSFSYNVLASKGNSSAIMGFWIKHDVLKSWTDLADELSLNSLDIQPAEAALIPEMGSEAELRLQEDLVGNLRYSCSCIQGDLPNYTLGRLPIENLTAEKIAGHLKFQGPDWSSVKKLRLSDKFEKFDSLAGLLGIEETVVDDEVNDAISEYAIVDSTNHSHTRYNYRKGEYAQRGIGERIVVPVSIVAIAVIAIFGVLAWQSFKLSELEAVHQENITKEKHRIWSETLPEDKIPSERIDVIFKSKLIARNDSDEGGSGDGPKRTSTVQTLGRFFRFIKSDPDILITHINISKTAVNISGRASDAGRISRLAQGFDAPDQTYFDKPRLSFDPVKVKEGEKQEFTFKIRCSIKKEPRKKKGAKK